MNGSDGDPVDFLRAALRPQPSCIAVGCDQQLVRRVMAPPAQHHTGTEHAQHLQGEEKKA